MLDWNGNGKIDPVDIGISVAAKKKQNPRNPRQRIKNLMPDA